MEVEQPALSEYPIMGDKMEILSAYTIYKFVDRAGKDGRWQAVLKVKSTYQNREGGTDTSVSIRVYRWRWKQATKWNPSTQKAVPSGDYKWTREQELTINKIDLWNTIKNKVEEFTKDAF